MAPATTTPRTRLLGGLALWFAVLGGALAWALHLFAAWGTDELVCASGHEDVSGTSLRVVLLLTAAVPLAITLAALGVAWLAWRRTAKDSRPETGGDEERRFDRTRLMALVGLCSNVLFTTIIIFGGAAIFVFPPCQR